MLIVLNTACSVPQQTYQASQLQSIPLELTTQRGNQQVFFDGDEIQFLLSLGSNAYIYLYHIDASNNLRQILPSKEQSSNYYSSGYFLTIPEYDDHYRFKVSRPFGEETMWAIASDQSTILDHRTLSIEEIKKKIRQASRLAYGEYELKFKTRER